MMQISEDFYIKCNKCGHITLVEIEFLFACNVEDIVFLDF